MEEKIYRLLNHDNSHTKPKFESFTVAEYNKTFGTNYSSVEEAINADPEYCFTEQESIDYTDLP
jgi:hypothetical protein